MRSSLFQNSDIWVKWLIKANRFFCTSHVYAEYHDNRNCKDGSYGHLNNQYTRNAYGLHN